MMEQTGPGNTAILSESLVSVRPTVQGIHTTHQIPRFGHAPSAVAATALQRLSRLSSIRAPSLLFATKILCKKVLLFLSIHSTPNPWKIPLVATKEVMTEAFLPLISPNLQLGFGQHQQ